MAACFSFQIGTMLQVYEERLSLQYPINTILSSMNAKRVLSMAAISIPVNILIYFSSPGDFPLPLPSNTPGASASSQVMQHWRQYSPSSVSSFFYPIAT